MLQLKFIIVNIKYSLYIQPYLFIIAFTLKTKIQILF